MPYSSLPGWRYIYIIIIIIVVIIIVVIIIVIIIIVIIIVIIIIVIIIIVIIIIIYIHTLIYIGSLVLTHTQEYLVNEIPAFLDRELQFCSQMVNLRPTTKEW